MTRPASTAEARAVSRWQPAGILIAAGAFLLGAGLMLGPGPGTDTAQALENIEGFRTRYVATNAVDLVGVLVMVSGLLVLARLQSLRGGGLLSLLGAVASALGGLMLVLTLVLQSAVDPELAERYVAASGEAREAHLAVAEAVFDIDAVVFGVGFLFTMGGIALLAGAALAGAGPALSRPFLLVGTALAAVASGTALLVPFGAPDDYAVVESILGLIVLVWLVALGTMLALGRADEG